MSSPVEPQAGISDIRIEDEMRQSYLDYAMSVIIGRALPDVRDGLKPVQRRVLYAMFSEGLTADKKHSKCAGVVGEVLKKFHPHGDSSVYDALVRLAQTWTLRYPLVDGQGNFGSIDGDPPAAYRYTECRMTKLAQELLRNIDNETVDFQPNFDNSTEEPMVLPAVLPSLVINGADGIAVGMATHIPPHNLSEVIDGTIALIKNPATDTAELMSMIPGPDFPTGGQIYGRAGIASAYLTGKGIIQVRGRTHTERIKGRSREVEAIIIDEIPFQVNKTRLIERIAELVREKLIDGISDMRDESDREGMRIVVELKRDATAEVVLNQLFKLAPLQTSFGIINLAIVDGKPLTCTLKQLLEFFINHRREVVTRRTQYALRKAQERMHILEGFRIALLNIDAIIALIKAAQTPPEARVGLMNVYALSEVQAQAILDLRLQKLTGMERLSIEQEHAELASLIAGLLAILSDPLRVDAIIVDELAEMKEQFGDKRRTEIIGESADLLIEDLIEDEDMVVTVSHEGYVKRTPMDQYRAQLRGGKGVTGSGQKEEDFVEHLFVASTLADLMVFTNQGRVYWTKVYQLPESSRVARGRALVNLLNLKPDEKLTAILPLRSSGDKNGADDLIIAGYVVMATALGVIKKVELADFMKSRRTNGIIACTLRENDSLIGVGFSAGTDHILIATREGIAIRFEENDVRAMGRNAAGVRSISLSDSDRVVAMALIKDGKDQEGTTLMTVCENGYGKRTQSSEYRVQGRGGKGVIDIITEDRNGPVVGAFLVNEQSETMIITSGGKVIRFLVNGLSIIGRNRKGVRVIGLDEGEKVMAVAHRAEGDGELEETPSAV